MSQKSSGTYEVTGTIDRQRAIYLAGLSGQRPAVPIDPRALEPRARAVMSPEAFAYVAGGAGSESTAHANQAAFERWRIVPRMLNDVSHRDTSIELFGRRLPGPLLLCPIGVLDLAHADGDLAVARAAASEGVPMIFSNQASQPMEACARLMGDAPRWFQLYWSKSDELVASLAARAEACGCDAIVVTLDTTMLGWRTRDLDLAYLPFLLGKGIAQYTSDPAFLKILSERTAGEDGDFPASTSAGLSPKQTQAAARLFIETYSRPSLTWADLAFLRRHTSLPIVLKGILHPDDARKALDHGIDGVIVSNHGGRQVDGAIASFDALPRVVKAVAGKIPVILDSGIRGGAHVFKALAMGATAVGVGRPWVYALAIAGETGVREVIQNLKADFDLTMGLAGCRTVADITGSALRATLGLAPV